MLVNKIRSKIIKLESDLSTARNQMYILELIELIDSKNKIDDELTLLNNNLHMLIEDISQKKMRKQLIDSLYQDHQNLKILKKIFKSWNRYSQYRKHIIKKNPVLLPKDIFKIVLSFITIKHTEIVVKLLHPERYGKPTTYIDQNMYGIQSWNIKLHVKHIIRTGNNDLRMEFIVKGPILFYNLNKLPIVNHFRKLKPVYSSENENGYDNQKMRIGYTFKYRYKIYFIPIKFLYQLPLECLPTTMKLFHLL